MEKRDIFSLWLGYFKSEDELERYVEWKFPAEDEEEIASYDAKIRSLFSQHFQIGYFELDLQEPVMLESASDNINMLEGNISYYKQLISAFKDKELTRKYNACILLCDYDYEENCITRHDLADDYYVDFIGTAPYDRKDHCLYW